MTDEQDEKQRPEKSPTADGGDQDDGINDPLTRRDVEAPRAPFGQRSA